MEKDHDAQKEAVKNIECRMSNIEQQNDEGVTSTFEILCSTCPQCLCVFCSNTVMWHYYYIYHLSTDWYAWQAGILRFTEFGPRTKGRHSCERRIKGQEKVPGRGRLGVKEALESLWCSLKPIFFKVLTTYDKIKRPVLVALFYALRDDYFVRMSFVTSERGSV